jgi:hypothetical protein
MKPVAPRIMIIRHAEKPTTDGAPFGVDEDGSHGANGGRDLLLVRGWQRAGGLASLFAPALRGLSTPAHLFACDPGGGDSERPYDTILPLSRKLGVAIDGSYGQDDYAAMIEAATRSPGAVLIAWEHKRIRKITALLPRRDGEPPDAFRWPGARFDVVFVFDLDPATGTYAFRQVPQMLLDGDSDEPIDVRATNGD